VLPQNAWIVPAAQVQQVSSMTIDSVPAPDGGWQWVAGDYRLTHTAAGGHTSARVSTVADTTQAVLQFDAAAHPIAAFRITGHEVVLVTEEDQNGCTGYRIIRIGRDGGAAVGAPILVCPH